MAIKKEIIDYLLKGRDRPPLVFAAKSNGMDAPAFNGISCAKVGVSSNHLIQQGRPR